jgi:hypothetical protein
MLGVRNLSGRAGWASVLVLLAGGLLAAWISQRESSLATPAVALDDWDIPQLVAYLNGQGLELRVVATQRDGVIHQTVYLTTTDKEWTYFNRLPNDRNQIDLWRGTLYCVRGPIGPLWSTLLSEWGECSLVIGPFLLYGDCELLGRVRAALTKRGTG